MALARVGWAHRVAIVFASPTSWQSGQGHLAPNPAGRDPWVATSSTELERSGVQVPPASPWNFRVLSHLLLPPASCPAQHQAVPATASPAVTPHPSALGWCQTGSPGMSQAVYHPAQSDGAWEVAARVSGLFFPLL